MPQYNDNSKKWDQIWATQWREQEKEEARERGSGKDSMWWEIFRKNEIIEFLTSLALHWAR